MQIPPHTIAINCIKTNLTKNQVCPLTGQVLSTVEQDFDRAWTVTFTKEDGSQTEPAICSIEGANEMIYACGPIPLHFDFE